MVLGAIRGLAGRVNALLNEDVSAYCRFVRRGDSMAELLTGVPINTSLSKGDVVRIHFDAVITRDDGGDNVEVTAPWYWPNPLIFARMIPREWMIRGKMVLNG